MSVSEQRLATMMFPPGRPETENIALAAMMLVYMDAPPVRFCGDRAEQRWSGGELGIAHSCVGAGGADTRLALSLVDKVVACFDVPVKGGAIRMRMFDFGARHELRRSLVTAVAASRLVAGVNGPAGE